MPWRARIALAALVFAAPAFAQDWYEPNASRARLAIDEAYTRESATSIDASGIYAAVAIRLDDQGRVVLAGSYGSVARLDVDGRLDPTFGDAGVAKIPVWGNTNDLEIDSAGRIVVTGFFGDPGSFFPSPEYSGRRYGAARLLADGSLDPAFSGDGLLDLDPATGVDALDSVHAAGDDGAMLALATMANPVPDPVTGLRQDPFVGVVRITSDGTIDATYGGGFARLAKYSDIPPFAPISYDVRVADFVVDAAGRALVALTADAYGPSVQRLDTRGDVELSTPYSPNWFYATRLALDGAGRIVGSTDAGLLRILPDGAPDPTFGGDGYALNQLAGFLGPAWSDRWIVCAYLANDPDFDGVGCVDELLAVARDTDRWALARVVVIRNSRGRAIAEGIRVQSIDPANPGAIASVTYRPPGRHVGRVVGLAVAPDGGAAYAVGNTFVVRVVLADPEPGPLPDLRVRWLGFPRAVDFGGGRYRVTARVRIRNASRCEATAAWGLVGFAPGSYDVPLVDGPHLAVSGRSVVGHGFRVRGRSSVVKRFTCEGGDAKTNLAGVRLSIQAACELPDANFADNTATSRPMTPLYAPR